MVLVNAGLPLMCLIRVKYDTNNCWFNNDRLLYVRFCDRCNDRTKLYQLDPKSYFKLENDDEVYFFDHLDGMYSYCLDKDNNIIHFACWTPIEEVKK